MKNIIEYQETGQASLFEIYERYHYPFFHPNQKTWARVSFITSFQVCNIYTLNGTIFQALKKLDGVTTFPLVFDLDNKRLTTAQTVEVVSKIDYNNNFNCHGFTFLNGDFWFLLTNVQVDTIIRENDYQPCRIDTLKEGGICLYYNYQNELIHSAKVLDGVIQSKFGVNTVITRGEQEIIDKYNALDLDTSKTKYYNIGFIPFGGKWRAQ